MGSTETAKVSCSPNADSSAALIGSRARVSRKSRVKVLGTATSNVPLITPRGRVWRTNASCEAPRDSVRICTAVSHRVYRVSSEVSSPAALIALVSPYIIAVAHSLWTTVWVSLTVRRGFCTDGVLA